MLLNTRLVPASGSYILVTKALCTRVCDFEQSRRTFVVQSSSQVFGHEEIDTDVTVSPLLQEHVT